MLSLMTKYAFILVINVNIMTLKSGENEEFYIILFRTVIFSLMSITLLSLEFYHVTLIRSKQSIPTTGRNKQMLSNVILLS